MNKFPIEPIISAKESAARITNKNAEFLGKLKTETVLIQPFIKGRGFAHHAAMTIFKNRIYAMWSSGRVNEDDCGQRVMWSYSDGYNKWAEPMPFADTEQGEYSEYVKFAQGFFATEDKLFAYYLQTEYKPEDLRGENLRPLKYTPWLSCKRFCRVLNEDGLTWGEPIEMGDGGGNHSAERLNSGRYMVAMATGVKYVDSVEDMPIWTESNLPDSVVEAVKPLGAKELCEVSFYETDDGILHLLMRSGEFRLWHAESYDNGETIKEVYPTEFSDDLAKFQFGRLPDGRYYYVGNPTPKSGRLPLALLISENGYDFNKQYNICDEPVIMNERGLDKGGHYGYPECVIHEGYMYVIYSKQKEEIEITRFDLNQLK